MYLSLALALVTYLLSPKGTTAERQQALMAAAAVGGLSYVATANTDWGKNLSTSFDGAIGVGTPATAVSTDAANTTSTAQSAAVAAPNSAASTSSTGGGLWSSISGWGAAAVGAVAGGTLASGSSWILPAAIAAGLFLILR